MHRMRLDGAEFRFSASSEGAKEMQRDGTPKALSAA
jgi:hypothetical protein